MQAHRSSLRLFDNPALERVSFAGPLQVTAIWFPAIVAAATFGATHVDAPAETKLLVAGSAVLGWTLFEYMLHRFIFHFQASSRTGKWLLFVVHGCHHADPQDKRRNMMTPAVTLLAGAVILALAMVVAGPGFGAIGFAGFMAGYLAYDLVHYACHQLDLPWLRSLKRRHLAHHFAGHDANFAVTFPLWDAVLGTAALAPRHRRAGRQVVDDREHP